MLSPFLSRNWILSYIKDTTDFLQQLQIFDHIPINAILVTIDVIFLYTNISHNKNINSVAKILKLFGHDEDFIDEINASIYLILKNNIFTFNKQSFIEVSGTAMGTKMARKYANIIMAKMEKSLFAALNKLRMCYFRILDDVFMIWTSGQESLNEFLNLANDFYPSIKFTTETFLSEIHFLDITILLRNNKFETKIYS